MSVLGAQLISELIGRAVRGNADTLQMKANECDEFNAK